MDDHEIVSLYWSRSQDAISQTKTKYGSMLMQLARSLLRVREDAEECVSDTYLAAWRNMPSDRPSYLGAYLSKITRRICIDRFRYNMAEKRNGGILAPLDELAECIPDDSEIFDTLEVKRLGALLNAFLDQIEPGKRHLFLARYYAGKSVKEIARESGMSESNVKTSLFRIRQALKERLIREDILNDDRKEEEA